MGGGGTINMMNVVCCLRVCRWLKASRCLGPGECLHSFKGMSEWPFISTIKMMSHVVCPALFPWLCCTPLPMSPAESPPHTHTLPPRCPPSLPPSHAACRCLQYDPHERSMARDLLHHPWVACKEAERRVSLPSARGGGY